jgi:hypothetical protein
MNLIYNLLILLHLSDVRWEWEHKHLMYEEMEKISVTECLPHFGPEWNALPFAGQDKNFKTFESQSNGNG